MDGALLYTPGFERRWHLGVITYFDTDNWDMDVIFEPLRT